MVTVYIGPFSGTSTVATLFTFSVTLDAAYRPIQDFFQDGYITNAGVNGEGTVKISTSGIITISRGNSANPVNFNNSGTCGVFLPFYVGYIMST
jgi:hypothetical protein